MEPTRPIMIPFDQSIFREITDEAVEQRMLLEKMHYRQQYELARKQELEKMIFLQSTAFRAANEPALTFIQQSQRPSLGPENFLIGNSSPFSEKASLLTKQEGLEADFERRLSSSRVKLKLKECLLTRRQQQSGSTVSPPQAQPVPQWTSIDSQASPPQACMLSYPLSGNSHKGFPIRKTSSEPNLKVKSALKQKVIDRRSSPLLKRQQHKAFVNNSGGSQGNSLNSPVSSGAEEPAALETALSSLGNYAPTGGFSLPPDDLTSHTSLPNLNNCRLAQNSSTTASSEGESGSLDLTSSDAAGENSAKGGRHPTLHCLNRASSSPLLIRDACATNSLQIAVQEQKMLVKKHLRQKVLTKNLLSENEKCSPPVPTTPGRAGANFRACLERTASSPIMKLPSPIKEERSHEFSFSTALVYDPGMLSHQCLCGTEENHPENPARLAAIWQRMQDTKLVSRCDKVRGRKASLHELQSCHSETFTVLYGTSAINRDKINPRLLSSVKFCRLPCQGVGIDSDTVWNETHTASAARIAAGCVLALATRVAQREVPNGFALVRPPGHHAEVQQAMGFCYFNSVAVAARTLLRSNPEMKRILILDWDVHHGNGTQQIFYNDPSVLYISLHRYDQGRFFPGTGSIKEVGEEAGLGFNVNIAWSGADLEPSKMGDAEYMAAFRCIVMPLARQFAPDFVLVSAGFDGTAGHPHALGGYELSPAIFAWMTEQAMKFADGKIVLSLEGGYDVPSLCDSVEACVKTLMNEEDRPQVTSEELHRQPNNTAVRCLKAVLKEHRKYWSCLERVDFREAECSQDVWQHPEESTVAAMAELSVEPESMEIANS